ncbi:MAG: CPBP family intramembrane metalloprotease, partial [Bacteroidales bacterium]|nr:CPBP family intramembrane metalloprotease [Bacteroidales bacterium]
YGFFPRMVLGILFGYLFVWTNSLWVPIFAHFLNNAAAVVVAFLASTDVIKTDYESFGVTENYSFVIISFVVTIVLLAFIYFHEKNRGSTIS